MKHLGDITKLSGCTVTPVDVVIGGSPCQDLSIAGKRAGLAGARSGLFLEQIRLIKEMRDSDIRAGRAGQYVRPRYMVWENVPGAFSSNRGEDFWAVLQETARVADESAVIPRPTAGKWRNAGCIMGDGWSIAWRVLDAQFWGVPQRRRRIALVADFAGHAAPEILFVRKSVCGDPAAGREAREGAAEGIEGGTDRSVLCLQGNMVDRDTKQNGSGVVRDVAYTLDAADRHAVFCAGFKAHASASAYSIGYEAETAPTIDTGKPMAVYDARGNGDGRVASTLTGGHEGRVTDYTAVMVDPLPFDTTQITSPQNRSRPHFGNPCHPLAAQAHPPAIVMSTGQVNACSTPLYDLAPTLNFNHEQANSTGGDSLNLNNTVRTGGFVRRLTPLECERLQGYPDGWTDIGAWTDSKGKLHKESSDAARYKALGNSIALPPWVWVLKRLCACYERPATMASLFDGIGGFPLIWERLNGPGSCLWASEIEEFPMAVTKNRFFESEAKP